LLKTFVAFSFYLQSGEKNNYEKKEYAMTYEQLLEVAKERQLTQQQIIRMLKDLIIHNETYLISRINIGQHSGFDDVLLQAQPALALAISMLEEQTIGSDVLDVL